MDLETFMTEVYVFIDDWYKAEIAPQREREPEQQLSESEVLTLSVLGQWRVGVPWRSERGLVRYVQSHLRGLFPHMLGRSRFNERARRLYGVMVQLQEHLVALGTTATAVFERVDCVPVPAYSNGQALREKAHWLTTATRGKGGYGWFHGYHLLASVSQDGLITGWLLGAAHINDRWLLEAFLSARRGRPQLVGPAITPGCGSVATPPVAHIGPWEAVGPAREWPFLADKGFNGRRWQWHWWDSYLAWVITVPPQRAQDQPAWSRAEKKWLASKRQGVETAFATLQRVFGLADHLAHSMFGLYARLAAKVVAYNFAIMLNRRLGRPQGSIETLIA